MKSLKIQEESSKKELQKQIKALEESIESSKNNFEGKLEEYKILSGKLTDTLEQLTIDNGKKEQRLKILERAKINLEMENDQLKEELTAKISQLNSLKESNFKLTEGVNEAIKKIEDKNGQIDRMKESMDSERRQMQEKNL